MCKSCEENVDHLLLHCLVVMELWNFIFVVFGVKWVIPKTVKGLFQCWQHSSKTLRNSVWNVIRNRTFEDPELSIERFLSQLAELLLYLLSLDANRS